MRKICAIIAAFSIILHAQTKERETISDVQVTFNEQYKSFDKAFSDQFKNKKDIWLVLGNRGATNYYRERFSKNWIFWDSCSSSDSLGISGNFLDPKNWKRVSALLPKKVNYIAVDFNDLLSYPKRNNVIKAAKDVLNSEGIFCIEDIYDNRKKQFQHFTDKDFEQLSEDFEIEYVYWDGYISSLPYTSDQSANKKTDMFKGLEMMILRLAAANSKEKKKILPYITPSLYRRSFLIGEDLIKKLIRDIADSIQLKRLIRNYEEDLEKEKHIAEIIEKEKKEIESLKKDVDNFSKIVSFSGNVGKKFESLTKNINVLNKGADYLTTVRRSVINKLSKVVNKSSDDSKGLKEQLEEKKSQLADREKNLAMLQNQLDLIKNYIKDSTDKILKHNNEVFSGFKRDKYLKSYVAYKKEKLEDIISDSKNTDNDFWAEYDSFWNSISDTEILATELEKSWSPDILIQNIVSLETIKSDAEQKISDTSRIMILFIKK